MVTRKQYTKEFKLDAISLVLNQCHTTSEVSQSLEINANMLRRWIREYQADDADQSFRGNGKLTSEQEEIRQFCYLQKSGGIKPSSPKRPARDLS